MCIFKHFCVGGTFRSLGKHFLKDKRNGYTHTQKGTGTQQQVLKLDMFISCRVKLMVSPILLFGNQLNNTQYQKM